MALQGHLEAMKMEEVVAWLRSWLRTGAAKESPSRSVAWEPRGHLKLLCLVEHEHQTLCIRGLL
jgi:hypothetical protein